MSPENAVKVYHNGVERVLAVLETMDQGNAVSNFEPLKQMVEERFVTMERRRKWYLLNKLFGLRPSQIARLEGLREASGVRALIIWVSDQLRSGEISLIETSPEEAEQAKARLDALRNNRRLRHAKKKTTVK